MNEENIANGKTRGRFVTLEGGEGCGKSTQVKRLAERLRLAGKRVLLTREPGGTPLSEKIRTLLKDEKADPPCDRAELLLFLAARAQLVKNVIRPALAEGAWVVSDRFSDSTFAYQGYGRGLPLDILEIANGFACEGLKPDLTLLLDADPALTAERMRKREAATATAADRIELAGDAFHRRLREGFLEMAARDPKRIVKIDAAASPDEVEEEIWIALKPLI